MMIVSIRQFDTQLRSHQEEKHCDELDMGDRCDSERDIRAQSVVISFGGLV